VSDAIRLNPSPAATVDGALPAPRRVAFDAPWNWLAAGWRDMWAVPGVSLAYGAIFAGIAALLVMVLSETGAHAVFLALAGGFLLLAPWLAVGLYDASRRLSRGETVTLGAVAHSSLGAQGQLAFFGALLLFAFLVWMQLAFLLRMLFLGSTGLPPPSAFMHTLLFTNKGLGLLVVGSLVGGALAVLVYTVSAVAVPMLLDRRTDAISAARASVLAVAENPKPMALWAGLIVVIIGAGFFTLLVGLVLAFPLVGHATWHAYQDVYGSGVKQS